MAAPRRSLARTALGVAVITVALVVPLSNAALGAATDRCLDFEVLTSTPDEYEGEPLFDVETTQTVTIGVQVTVGDGNTLVDDLGTFDCPGDGVSDTVDISVSTNLTTTMPPTVTTGSDGTGTFDITNEDADSGWQGVSEYLSVSGNVTGSDGTTYESVYFAWGLHGYPGGVSCAPIERTLVPNSESRSILVTATDSWADPVPDVPVDVTVSNAHPLGTIVDQGLTDENGQVATSYAGTTTGQDYINCWVDGDDDDSNDFGHPDAGAGYGYTDWVSISEITNGNVELDADPDLTDPDELDWWPVGSEPSLTYCKDTDRYDDVGNGTPNTPSTYNASNTGIPVNAVQLVCLSAATASKDYLYRPATVTLSGPGMLVESDGTPLGTSYTYPFDRNDPYQFWVYGGGVGTTTMTLSVDGVSDTDTATLGWELAEGADEARVIACSGGGWTELPDTASASCTVTDGLGNPVPGVSIDWSRANGDGTDAGFDSSDNTTDANGQVDAVLSATAEGKTVVTAAVDDAGSDCAAGAPADGPDALDAGKPAGTCSADVNVRWSDDGEPTTVASGGDTSTDADGESDYTITVSDAEGDPVDGVDVKIVVDGETYTGTTDENGQVTFTLPGGEPGDADVQVFADLDGDGTYETEVAGESIQRNGLTVFAGSGRLETAIKASQERFADHAAAVRGPAAVQDQVAGAVVLARADNFPDALAGTPLAVANNAPLLLSATEELSDVTAAEIDRVLPDGGTVYLLGGEAALSQAVEDAVDARWNAVRLGGTDRFATAVAIAQETNANPGTVLVTTGTNFADALTAGAAAAEVDGVVVLSGDSEPIPATTDYLATVSSADVVAVGGPAARAYPAADPLVGANRLLTGLEVAQRFFTDPARVGLARADLFPDGLSGGTHIGLLGGPLLLANGQDPDGLGSLPNQPIRDYLVSAAASAYHVFVYGGDAAVDEPVRTDAKAAIS